MKWIYNLLALLIIGLVACSSTNVDVKIPQGSSKILNVRKDHGNDLERKYSYVNSETDNEITELKAKDAVGYPEKEKAQIASLQVKSGAEKERRLAMVIGNSTYINGGSLPNPVNDAKSMATTLKELGFDVFMKVNASEKEMKKAIDTFGEKLKAYDIGLFFYAGHGLQVKGNNYLIPSDANIKTENDVDYNSVDAGRILSKMEDAGSKANIIILDACRDNPFERSWTRSARGKGLAFMNAPSGSIIAYATSPGNTALDGRGKNGVYTSAILKHIKTPNLSIEEMFKKVRVDVEEETKKSQIPWESTSLKGSFFFNISQ